MGNVDSALALTVALFVNAAILILAAAVFHSRGLFQVGAIEDAYKLLSPLLGAAGASTMLPWHCWPAARTPPSPARLPEQVVMEGFIHIKLAPWKRRMITRGLAIFPPFLSLPSPANREPKSCSF